MERKKGISKPVRIYNPPLTFGENIRLSISEPAMGENIKISSNVNELVNAATLSPATLLE